MRILLGYGTSSSYDSKGNKVDVNLLQQQEDSGVTHEEMEKFLNDVRKNLSTVYIADEKKIQ
jgi:hypothetical protein